MSPKKPNGRDDGKAADDSPKLYAVRRDGRGGFQLSRREFLGAATASAVASQSGAAHAAANDDDASGEDAAEGQSEPLTWGRVEMPQDKVEVGELRAHRGKITMLDVAADGRILTAAAGDSIKSWDFRKWELLSTKRQEMLECAYSDLVYSVAFSPDGKTIASGNSDMTIKLSSTASGKCLRTLKGHSGLVEAVTISPDGKTIASASSDSTVKLWNSATGECLRTLEGHASVVKSVSFSPDGKTIVSGSMDRTAKVWSAVTGECLRTLDGSSPVESVAFSPDGKTIVTGSWDQDVKLWSTSTGERLKTLEGHSHVVQFAVFSRDGKTIASCSSDRTVKLWSTATGECLRTSQGHSEVVCSVAFSPDGTTIVSGGYDKHVKLWSTATGECLRTFEGHSGTVPSVAFSPDGRTIASGGSDKTIRLWNVFDSSFEACAFRPDEPALVVLADGRLAFDDKTLQSAKSLAALGKDLGAPIACSPKGSVVAAVNREAPSEVDWVDLSSVRKPAKLKGHSGKVLSVDFPPCGRHFVTGGADNTVKFWDGWKGSHLWTITADAPVVTTRISPDGQLLAVGTKRKVVVHDLTSRMLLHAFDGTDLGTSTAGDARPIAFWPDSGRLAVGCGTNVQLFEVDSYRSLRTLSGHKTPVTILKVSPGGKLLMSGDEQGVVIIWDASTFQKAWVLFDQDAMEKRRNLQSIRERVLRNERWICTCNTIVVPAGNVLPAGAICVCNTIAVGASIPGGGSVKRTSEREGGVCACDTVCTCNTICTCNTVSSGSNRRTTTQSSAGVCTCNTICTCNTVSSGGYGGHYWYPN